jgi:hypothetical protein
MRVLLLYYLVCVLMFLASIIIFRITIMIIDNTVDGRNPAPVDGWLIPLFTGFQPSKVMQDFFHPQYVLQ